ncbi:MAG: ATP-binding protein [Desulfurellales bacterium]|nr:MAG: ATP-binding protein [Desulfurellales bacterium]
MHWSPQQVTGLDEAAAWLKACRSEIRAGMRLSRPIFRLFGFAGTGKTTLAKHLAGDLRSVCYAAFTGKAALMMERNGCAGASTIHGLIYQVAERADGSVAFIWDADSAAKDADLLVIDECSMVDEEIAADLMRYGRPILVLGDPAQLPPVKGTGYFTEAQPDVMLTEIHRQAADNPIIQLATATRLGERLKLGEYGASRVIERGVLNGREVLAFDQVLVGKNDTRRTYNARMRLMAGFTEKLPEPGDRLVCLRNDKPTGIFNGGLFRVVERLELDRKQSRDFIKLLLHSEDFPRRNGVEVKIHKSFFLGGYEDLDWRDLKGSQQFDFGYALTCHKSQGSQWPSVLVYDESGTFRDEWARWLYTAITRAQEKVTVVQ